jgi:WD40 repeat protein
LDANGALTQVTGHGGPVHAMFLLKDGTPVGVSHDGSLLIWKSTRDTPIRVKSHALTARALAVSDGGTLATGGDDRIVLLHLPGRVEPLPLSGHTARVRALAFSPDGKLLASGGDDRMLWVWDARNGNKRFLVQMPQEIEVIHALAFSPDGRRLAIAGRDGLVRELDLRTHKLLPAWERRHQGYIRSLAYSADGRVLATGGRDGSVWLWEARSGRPMKQLKGHSDDVNSLDFDSRQRLLSASDDKTVRLWDTTRDRVTVFRGLRPFSTARFSKGGARILAIDDREALTGFDVVVRR